MKKILLLAIALMLLLTACNPGKGGDETSKGTESDTEVSGSLAEEIKTTRAQEIETTTSQPEESSRNESKKYSKESFFKDYPLFAERTFIGRPIREAFEKYGRGYQESGYGGSRTFVYDEITFFIDYLPEIDESQPISFVAIFSNKKGADGKTFAQLKEIIPELEEPTYNDMDDYYSSYIEDGVYSYAFVWPENNYMNNDFTSVMIGRLDFRN